MARRAQYLRWMLGQADWISGGKKKNPEKNCRMSSRVYNVLLRKLPCDSSPIQWGGVREAFEADTMAGIKDVAKMAGVSVSTVSNVINGRHAKMGKDTLRRVQEAISALEYRPSAVARQLKSGQNKTLGLLVPSVANPFWGTVSQLIEKAALKRGYQVLICNAERDPALEATYMASLHGAAIRGAILGSSPMSFDHLRRHAEKGMHIAAFDRTSHGADEVVSCSVSVDQALGARLVTRHLIGLGHKRIVFMSGPIGTSSRIARLEGCVTSWKRTG